MEKLEKLTEREEKFLKEAFKYAKLALSTNEVPVGCVIVYKDEVIAFGHNETNRTKNPTRHAEFIAIDKVLEKYPKDIFEECELFVTIEPCVMCSSALLLLKFKKVYCCAGNERFGGCGSCLNINQDYNFHKYLCYLHPSTEAIELLKEFYEQDNPNKKIKYTNN